MESAAFCAFEEDEPSEDFEDKDDGREDEKEPSLALEPSVVEDSGTRRGDVLSAYGLAYGYIPS